MSKILGSAPFSYRVCDDWAKLPAGWRLGDVAGVAVDSLDRVYVFHRGDHPLIVFDRHGNVLDSWGDDRFVRPHALHMGPGDTLYCTDEGGHAAYKCAIDGTVIMTLGTPGCPAPFQSGKPFNRCTHTAVSPAGDIYVSDGYGNARVHRFAADGSHISSWGAPGTAPGEFNVPHNITCDAEGSVYVADRENHRVQVFDPNGGFKAEWTHLHRPSGLFTTSEMPAISFIAEIGPYLSSNRGWPNLGPRISIVAQDGALLSRLDVDSGDSYEPHEFISPHSIAVDSAGDIYVGDVAFTGWPSLHPGKEVPANLRTLHKLERLAP